MNLSEIFGRPQNESESSKKPNHNSPLTKTHSAVVSNQDLNKMSTTQLDSFRTVLCNDNLDSNVASKQGPTRTRVPDNRPKLFEYLEHGM